MKKFLMTAIAVFMMSGTAVATENVVVVNNNATTVQAGNVIDKLITLINGYTKKVNAVKSVEELLKWCEECYDEMMGFEEKHADEIIKLEKTLTEEQMARYETKLEQAMEAFEAAVEKKTEQLMESYDVDDF
jgi:TolA-binding protein